MTVKGIGIYCADTAASVAFYQHYLGARVAGKAGDVTTLELDGGGVVELIQLSAEDAKAPIPDCDDGREGFWHIGVRVKDVAPLAAELHQAGVGFFIEPVFNPIAKVWCAFFYDPDGTVIELVGGDQEYSQVFDAAAAARRRAVPLGSAALFEHVAFTTGDWPTCRVRWEAAGYTVIGTLDLSEGDERGMLLYYLGDDRGLIVEVFTYTVQTNPPLDPAVRRGFAGILADEPTRSQLPLSPAGRLADGRTRYFDDAGLAVIDAR
ncbi:MAG: VOC family protein [Propionibacteriaceae bacterium]|jgi:catechol 2,3-dioxygenase-like lactoylglutathione lyase family enzyme|nr:VOC family protein [Propionibacteriaceae bacterium]